MTAAKSILAALVLAASFTGVAYARDEVFTAKFSAPVTESRVIASNTLWSCDGDTCRARPTHASTVRSCRQLAHETGLRVTAYGPEANPLTADEIARCNGETAQTQSAQN